MRWLKHMTATKHDEKVALLLDKLGHEGYGLWWMIIETIAASIESGSDKCSLRYPVSRWAAELQLHPPNVTRRLAAIAATGLLEMSCDAAGIMLTAPNLLKYRDEYSKKSGHSPDTLRSKKQKQIQKQNTEAEAEQESAQQLMDRLAPRVIDNGLGRAVRNPVRLEVESALHQARDRIARAAS